MPQNPRYRLLDERSLILSHPAQSYIAKISYCLRSDVRGCGFATAAAAIRRGSPFPGRAKAALEPTGEQIFRQQCAGCHGGRCGEGDARRVPSSLAGDKDSAPPGRFLAEKMPEDDPGACTGADAAQVAAYIHEAFLLRIGARPMEPAAGDRGLATYRTSISQRSGRPDRRPTVVRSGSTTSAGLRAVYFKSRKFRDSDRAIEEA